MTPEVHDVAAFTHLGRAIRRVPAGYAQTLRASRLDMAWVRHVVRQEELFDLSLALDDDTPIAQRFSTWLRDVTGKLGLAWSDQLVQSPTFLQFRSVGFHNDGRLLFGLDPSMDHFYLNCQMAGSGWFDVQVDGCGVQSHRVQPGDLYLFDQRLEHAWRSDGSALCKLFSVVVPKWAVLQLQSSRRMLTDQAIAA